MYKHVYLIIYFFFLQRTYTCVLLLLCISFVLVKFIWLISDFRLFLADIMVMYYDYIYVGHLLQFRYRYIMLRNVHVLIMCRCTARYERKNYLETWISNCQFLSQYFDKYKSNLIINWEKMFAICKLVCLQEKKEWISFSHCTSYSSYFLVFYL